jgi:hypothetical protein
MAAACLPARPRTAELSVVLDAIVLTNGTTSTDRPLRGNDPQPDRLLGDGAANHAQLVLAGGAVGDLAGL